MPLVPPRCVPAKDTGGKLAPHTLLVELEDEDRTALELALWGDGCRVSHTALNTLAALLATDLPDVVILRSLAESATLELLRREAPGVPLLCFDGLDSTLDALRIRFPPPR